MLGCKIYLMLHSVELDSNKVNSTQVVYCDFAMQTKHASETKQIFDREGRFGVLVISTFYLVTSWRRGRGRGGG